MTFSTVSGSLQPFMVDLLGRAAAYDRQKHPRHHRRLDDLLDIWSEHGYFGPDLLHKLREVVKHSASTGVSPSSNDIWPNEADAAKKLGGKEAPFIMPSTHGDPSIPYYDLPAGNLIPHIIPNSTIPLHPDTIKPLQFLAGPADGNLVQALKGFLKEVDQIYGTDQLVKDDGNIDIDELGQRVVRDEITGDILDGETYYGWSRAFCQQMKKRAPDGSRSRSRSRSGTRDLKRRRYSDSSMDSRTSRSRSQSPPGNREARYRSSSISRSRRSASHDSPYSPRQPSPPRFPPPHQASQSNPPPSYPYNAQYGPSGANFPPPPPQYPGWPPVPPPQFPAMAFPPPGPGINPSAFPPSFSGPPMSVPPGQPLPPGQYHFPPPHPGGQHGAWGPPGGRNWR